MKKPLILRRHDTNYKRPPSGGRFITCLHEGGRVSPEAPPGTVPGARRQRHCARGAAASGMLYTRLFIRGRAPPTLAEGQPEAARGVKGAQPPAVSFPYFLGGQEIGPPAGAGPGSSAAR